MKEYAVEEHEMKFLVANINHGAVAESDYV